jgi:DNA-binding NtrC family response regulator
LQENEIRRVGDDKVLSIDIRVITATNRNLRDLVRRGLFRQDLLFRLDVLKLKVPPLRERPEDIIALFERYVSESAKKYRKEIPVPSEGAKRLLINHIWEGNVRELRNTAERIAVLSDKDIIEESDIREALYDNEWESAAPSASEAGRDIPEEKMPEKDMLLLLCERFGGRKGKIAEYLGIDRTTLWRKLKRYRI